MIYSTTAGAGIPPRIIDLAKSNETIGGVEDPTKFDINVNEVLGITG